MRILIFSASALPLLDALGDYLARSGNDVISLTGRRTRARSLSGVRRMIMNFNGEGAADQVSIWKEALKNGLSGEKVLAELAGAWQPDFILARSSRGGAFFLRSVFPAAFVVAFASERDEHPLALDLDCRLFLDSQLRFAPDEPALRRFPAILRSGIQLAPVCIDTGFFAPGLGSAFSCWKLDSGHYHLLGLDLGGSALLAPWANAVARCLATDQSLAIVAMMDRNESGPRLLAALDSLPGQLSKRLFITNNPDRTAWRNLCASSAAIIFTARCQKIRALECVACGGSAWVTRDSGLSSLPGVNLLSGRQSLERQLLHLLAEPKKADPEAIARIRAEYAMQEIIPQFANALLDEFARFAPRKRDAGAMRKA